MNKGIMGVCSYIWKKRGENEVNDEEVKYSKININYVYRKSSLGLYCHICVDRSSVALQSTESQYNFYFGGLGYHIYTMLNS